MINGWPRLTHECVVGQRSWKDLFNYTHVQFKLERLRISIYRPSPILFLGLSMIGYRFDRTGTICYGSFVQPRFIESRSPLISSTFIMHWVQHEFAEWSRLFYRHWYWWFRGGFNVFPGNRQWGWFCFVWGK